MGTKRRGLLGVMFALALALGLVPGMSLTAYAAGVSYVDGSGNTQTVDATELASNTTSWTNGSCYIVPEGGLTISGRIAVNGTVNLILRDGATLTASAGITVTANNTLNIYAQSAGTGALSARGANGGRGTNGGNAGIGSIGSGYEASAANCGTINIYGGTITATGGDGESGTGAGAGIGGGGLGYESTGGGGCGTVSIYGGIVTATGGNGASANGAGIQGGGAGIGGGGGGQGSYDYPTARSGGTGGTVRISGGTVTATGGTGRNTDTASGIGGGSAGLAGSAGAAGTLTLGEGVKLYNGTDNTGTALDDSDGAERSYSGSRPQNMFAEYATYVALGNTAPAITITKAEGNTDENVPQVGDTLTATPSPANANPVTYVWYRSNEVIQGATGATYTVTADDVGKTITVKASQEANADGNGSEAVETAESSATDTIEKKTNTTAQITATGITVTKTDTGISFTAPAQVNTGTTETPVYKYEYGYKTGNATDYTWTDTLPISGLNPGTAYEVVVREKETATTAAGPISEPVTVTTNVTVAINGTPTQGQGGISVTTTPEKTGVTYRWYIGTSETPDGTGPTIVPSQGGGILTVEVLLDGEVIGTATTGETTVKTLAEVIGESTASPVTITLDGPVTGGISIPENKEVQLELNGQEVGGDITVPEGATLTITDNSNPQTGTVKGTVKANTGEVIILGGRYDKTPVATEPGTVTIEGGLFKTNPTVVPPYAVKDSGNTDYPYEVYSTYVALNDAAPTITLTKAEGNTETTPQVGDTLTATPSPANAKPVTYVWYRGNEVIEGATGATYTVTADDVGKTIHAVAKQEANANGNGSAAVETSASNATAAVEKKTAAELSAADAEANGIAFTYADEAISANNGYEVSSTNTGDGTAIESLTAILDGEGTPTVYVRTAATDDTAAGAWVAVTLTPRPDAPTTLTAEPPTGTGDGKIKGTTADMEYKLKNSTGDWTTASASETSVAPGAYLVRTKATDTTPAGKTTEVVIVTATENVSGLIEALPEAANVTAADAGDIAAARAAYDALDADQQTSVGDNLKAKLEADEAALAIAALPAADAVTTTGKDAIEAARGKYDALSDTQKEAVGDTLKAKLEADEAALAIAALPETDNVITDNKAAIEAARAKYDELSDTQKEAVGDTLKAKLEAAEVALVNKLIDALPAANAVTTADKDAIEAARAAYDALTADQKAKVPADVLKKLEDAEDAAAAKAAADKINALPAADKVTVDDKAAIEAARATYDALTPGQKAIVDEDPSVLAYLLAAEEALEAAKPPIGDAAIAKIEDQVYTAGPIEPALKVTLDGKQLVAGADYDVAYKDNVEVGTATATVTGKGAYKGTAATTFKVASLAKKEAATRMADLVSPSWYLGTDGTRGGFFDDKSDTLYMDYTFAKGLMSGYKDNAGNIFAFGPDDDMSRAQAAVIIYRMANPGKTDTYSDAAAKGIANANKSTLPDVEDERYYTAAVNWCVAEGVITGYTDKDKKPFAFGPNDPITREQLATIIGRYMDPEATAGSSPDFADAGSISDWAKPGIAYCKEAGIMTGIGGSDRFEPQWHATRCQMSKVIAVTDRLGALQAAGKEDQPATQADLAAGQASLFAGGF